MKKLLSIALCLALMFSVSANAFAEDTGSEWHDSSAEEIADCLGLQFGYTAETEIISYQISEEAAQMQLLLNGIPYTARIQPTESFENISGYEFDSWPITDSCMIGWCEARAMLAQQDDQMIALCLWYDAAPGLMYSVSACVGDLKGLDIQSAAEAVFAPMQNEAGGITGEDLYHVLTACTGYAGTAGSSLKNAIAACHLAAFAAESQMADLDQLLLSEAAADALTRLDEEQTAELSFNLESIHSVLTEAFTDYEGVSGLFEDAGVAEEIERLLAAHRTYEHYCALYEELKAAGL